MSQKPYYRLRPNKSIDRNLFIQTLTGLGKIYPINEYCYTGFGSYLFDDFRMMHETLNISKMISLEKDKDEYSRAIYNLPYNCIDVKNIDSTEYLTDLVLDDDEHNIFWLDFMSPSELGIQLSDYATLLNLANANDVIRITLNANPESLGKCSDPDKLQAARLKALKERVPDTYISPSILPDDVTTKKYPLTLLMILKAIAMSILTDNPPYNSNFLLPLFSSVYADGQQMLTFTGIILDSHDREKQIKDILNKSSHNTFCWDKPCRIDIPQLTLREITEMNKFLPNNDTRQKLINEFPFVFLGNESMADSYISYYKYYPNYYRVSF